jgi:hypothetical protein
MPFKTGDFACALTDFGDTVVVSGVTGKGLLDLDAVVLEDPTTGAGLERCPSLLVRTGAFPALARGVAITVAGTAYTVRDLLPMDDGEITRVLMVP